MIDNIFKAIARKIGSELGTNYRVELEKREQGFQSGTFFIQSGNVVKQPGLGLKDENWQVVNVPIIIQYFTDGGNSDCVSKGERLLDILEWLQIDENTLIRSDGNFDFSIEGGILTFSILYKIHLKPDDIVLSNNNTWQNLDQGVKINGN